VELIGNASTINAMTDYQQHLEAPLWDLVVQRAAADGEFRDRLMTSPRETLGAMGLPVDDLEVVVRELNDRERIIMLPPMIATAGPSALAVPVSGAFSTEPPSSPIVGSACCALSDPADSRVTLGSETRHG